MTDSVIDVILRLDPTFPVVDLVEICSGRVWRVPHSSEHLRERLRLERVRREIKADPCRDIRVITKRYSVSRPFVYRIWRAA